MTARGTASRFLQSVLQNGVGRYICQLKRLSIVFSASAAGSRGVREYIEEGVVDFARQNPGIVVYVTPKKCHVPKLVAEYLPAIKLMSIRATVYKEFVRSPHDHTGFLRMLQFLRIPKEDIQ
ncbi:39S ribosomal protein L43, mitochondrial isoform X2 [Mobula hypostoma]|uniref:39S ribosomal protein L43, mitochondrial isoform X2 n=1 Tax=Mobula hypostoma TaxID=723540 RepID=UPI002FC3B606